MGSISTYIIIVIAAVFVSYECDALQSGCIDPDERCVPIGLCPNEYNRIKKGELSSNPSFKNHIKNKICDPVERTNQKKHICCRKSRIECQLDGERGACLLREECPLLQTTTEKKLIKTAEQNLCYVHDSRKYFCCTDPYCAHHKRLCEKREVLPASSRYPSLYTSCSSFNGTAGSLVPKVLCGDRSRFIEQPLDQRVCCLPPENPSQLIRHRNAAKLEDTQCGTVGYLDKLQNGTYTQPGEFPWMAYLVYTRRRSPVSVRLGVHTLLEKSEHVQVIRVVTKILNDKHDVGLLRLAKPAILDIEHVWPICLPVYMSTLMYLPPTVTITGWELTEKGTYVNQLMKTYSQVLINDTECPLDHVCVNQSNHCFENSGGPYQALSTYGVKSRFVQFGIISNGPTNCSHPERLSRGVSVGYIMNWILDNMVL